MEKTMTRGANEETGFNHHDPASYLVEVIAAMNKKAGDALRCAVEQMEGSESDEGTYDNALVEMVAKAQERGYYWSISKENTPETMIGSPTKYVSSYFVYLSNGPQWMLSVVPFRGSSLYESLKRAIAFIDAQEEPEGTVTRLRKDIFDLAEKKGYYCDMEWAGQDIEITLSRPGRELTIEDTTDIAFREAMEYLNSVT